MARICLTAIAALLASVGCVLSAGQALGQSDSQENDAVQIVEQTSTTAYDLVDRYLPYDFSKGYGDGSYDDYGYERNDDQAGRKGGFLEESHEETALANEDYEAYYQLLDETGYQDQFALRSYSIVRAVRRLSHGMLDAIRGKILFSLQTTWQQQFSPLVHETIGAAQELTAAIDWDVLMSKKTGDPTIGQVSSLADAYDEHQYNTDEYEEDMDVFGSYDDPTYSAAGEYGNDEYAYDKYRFDYEYERVGVNEEKEEPFSNSADREFLLGIAQTLERVGTTLHELSHQITCLAREKEKTSETALQSRDAEVTR